MEPAVVARCRQIYELQLQLFIKVLDKRPATHTPSAAAQSGIKATLPVIVWDVTPTLVSEGFRYPFLLRLARLARKRLTPLITGDVCESASGL